MNHRLNHPFTKIISILSLVIALSTLPMAMEIETLRRADVSSQHFVPKPFQRLTRDVFTTFCITLPPEDRAKLFSVSKNFNQWGIEVYYPETHKELNFSWDGMIFSTAYDQIRFNQLVISTINAFDKIDYKGTDKVYLPEYCSYFCGDIILKTQEAQKKAQPKRQDFFSPLITYFDEKPKQPLIPLMHWISECVQGTVEEVCDSFFRIDMPSNAVKYLRRYSSEITDLVLNPDPKYAAEYGLHVAVFGRWKPLINHGGNCDYYSFKTGSGMFSPHVKLPYICTPNNTPFCHPVTPTWLAQAALKDLFGNNYKCYNSNCNRANGSWLYLQYAEDCMDRELSKVLKTGCVLDPFSNNSFSHSHYYNLYWKSWYAVGGYDKVLSEMDFNGLGYNHFFFKVLQDWEKPIQGRRYYIWSLLALGKNKVASDEFRLFEENLKKININTVQKYSTDSTTLTEHKRLYDMHIYELCRSLVCFNRTKEAISHMKSILSRNGLYEEPQAFLMWCYKEIGNIKEEEHLKKMFLKDYSESILSYHYAHFERDKLGYTGKVKPVSYPLRCGLAKCGDESGKIL